MTDVVDKKTRSRMMSGIRGKNTKPELLVRRELHKRGYRYRLHAKDLPGTPDMVFPRYGAVVFVHGCFWHAHNCHLFKWPGSNKEFWRKKIGGNSRNDEKIMAQLGEKGWRALVVWECAMKGRTRRDLSDILDETERWLLSGRHNMAIQGMNE